MTVQRLGRVSVSFENSFVFSKLLYKMSKTFLGTFYHVTDLSRNLYMNTLLKDEILSWHVFAGRC